MIESGDVVRVMTRNGGVGYLGEVVRYEPGNYGRYKILTPDDGEVHDVPAPYVKPATERESDDYIARWVDGE